MSEDIKVTDGTILESLNGKVDLDGGNYIGSPLEEYIHDHCGGGLEIGDIGIAPLGIDETKGKRRYLNGQLIIQEQYVQFTNKVKSAVALYSSLACTESEWQATALLTVGGQVGKFVVDDEGGTIRLPKIIMPIQGLTDLSKLAEIVEAGLPDHTHTYTFKMSEDAGGSGRVTYGSNTPGSDQTLKTNGVNNNSIYGNSTTVQQEQIQYPYFIQVATGAETEDNIINEIELNNPFSLLDYKFSEYELNNLSWLRSQGQFNTKIVYPAVYDLLLKIYNGVETKAGVSVKLTTEEYTDTDFVLNTADETFRLPIKVKLASGKAVGGTEYGLRIQTIQSGVIVNGYLMDTASHEGNYIDGLKTDELLRTDTPITMSNNDGMGDKLAIGVHPDAETSGIETSDKGLYLYFYVGETVQNANLINAGRIEEKITEALAKPHIVETYLNDSSWYRVYSDGWCEQGAYINCVTGANQIVFLKPFVDTNYFIEFSRRAAATTTSNVTHFTRGRNVTSCEVYTSAGTSYNWYACGYMA